MKDKMRTYVSKYGEVKTWPLALQFQVLFEALSELSGKSITACWVAEPLYRILHHLSSIENSGVVQTKSDLKDRQFEDELHCEYVCGRYTVVYEESTSYSMRSGIDTDYCLTVNKA